MNFNFDQAKKSSAAALDNPYLELLLMGPSGAGKSFCLGTLGVKTLYVYFTRESHGPKTAAVKGGDNIVPICADFGVWPGETESRTFTADETLQYLNALLESYDWIKKENFRAIALDSMAALEVIVKESTLWKKKCSTAKGGHNSFKESEASQEILGMVAGAMKGAQRECGVHIIATAPLDVKDTDGYGGISEAAPKLQGYGVCEAVVANFGDVLVIGRMSRNNEMKWKFQSFLDVKKVSKDEHGNVKKILNFAPRVSGLVLDPIMDADLSLIIEMKKGKK